MKELYYCGECKKYWADGDPIWIPSGKENIVVFEKDKKLSTVQADLENAKMIADVCRVKICPNCADKIIIRKCLFCKRSHAILTKLPQFNNKEKNIETEVFVFTQDEYKWYRMRLPEEKVKINEVAICSFCESNAVDIIKDYGDICIIMPKFEVKETHPVVSSLKNFLARKYTFETDGELKFILSTMRYHYLHLQKATKLVLSDKELKIRLELQPTNPYYIRAKWRNIKLPKVGNTIAEAIK